MDWEALWGRF